MRLVAAKDSEELLRYVIYWAALTTLICLPSALILIRSTKASFLRAAWLPCWAVLTYHLCHSICTTWRSLPLRGVLGGNLGLIMLNILGMLVMRRLDDQDLIKGGVYKANDTLAAKIVKTNTLFFNLRAIGTSWQVNIVTLCPKFLASKRDTAGRQDRTWWIFRTTLIMVWQYLFLNLLEVQSLSQTPEETWEITGDNLEWPSRSLTVEQWAIRAAVALPAGLGPTRVGIDIWYRLTSLVFVVLGLSSPEAWPPLFGTIFSTSTIRGSWAGMTHRLVRLPLGTISNFIMEDIVGWPTRSLSGRVIGVFLVFLLSGLFHAGIEVLDDDGIPTHEKWQIVIYWTLSAAGIMFEEIIQAIWRRVMGEGKTRLWQKVVGYLWVGIFFTVTHPLFFYPAMRQGEERKLLVPVDVVTAMGMPVAGGVVVVGGILVMLGIKGEV